MHDSAITVEWAGRQVRANQLIPSSYRITQLVRYYAYQIWIVEDLQRQGRVRSLPCHRKQHFHAHIIHVIFV